MLRNGRPRTGDSVVDSVYVVVWVNIDVSKSGRNRRGVGYKVIRAACLGVWEELNRWEMEGWLIVMC